MLAPSTAESHEGVVIGPVKPVRKGGRRDGQDFAIAVMMGAEEVMERAHKLQFQRILALNQ